VDYKEKELRLTNHIKSKGEKRGGGVHGLGEAEPGYRTPWTCTLGEVRVANKWHRPVVLNPGKKKKRTQPSVLKKPRVDDEKGHGESGAYGS